MPSSKSGHMPSFPEIDIMLSFNVSERCDTQCTYLTEMPQRLRCRESAVCRLLRILFGESTVYKGRVLRWHCSIVRFERRDPGFRRCVVEEHEIESTLNLLRVREPCADRLVDVKHINVGVRGPWIVLCTVL